MQMLALLHNLQEIALRSMPRAPTGITGGVTLLHPITSRRVRWFVVATLFGLSFASYMERMNLSVAAELMMPALSLTKSDLGTIFNSFLLGYAVFQVPAGWLGDRFGSRIVLGLSALAWGVLTVLSGMLPGVISRTAAGTVALLVALAFCWVLPRPPPFPLVRAPCTNGCIQSAAASAVR